MPQAALGLFHNKRTLSVSRGVKFQTLSTHKKSVDLKTLGYILIFSKISERGIIGNLLIFWNKLVRYIYCWLSGEDTLFNKYQHFSIGTKSRTCALPAIPISIYTESEIRQHSTEINYACCSVQYNEWET